MNKIILATSITGVALSITLTGFGPHTKSTALSKPFQYHQHNGSDAVSASQFLTKVGEINLPGQGGHGDVVKYDPAQGAVYVSQSPDNNVIVINANTQKIEKVIPNMDGCQGIAVGSKYIYVANGTSNQVAVIRKGSWNVVATVPSGGNNPDGVYYDGKDHKVFVANDDTNTMGVISTRNFKLEDTFKLLPKNATSGPDLGVLITRRHRLYQSVDNQVDVINTASDKIIRQFKTSLPSNKSTKSMIYDPAAKRVWVGTKANMVYDMNPNNGKMIPVATQAGMDQISWDPTSKMLFLGESGQLEVVNMTTKKSIGTVSTENGFHTLAVDTNRHIVYAYFNYSNKMVLYQENMNH